MTDCSHRHWDVKVEETSSHIKTYKKCIDCPHTWDHQSATKLKPKPKLPKRVPRKPR